MPVSVCLWTGVTWDFQSWSIILHPSLINWCVWKYFLSQKVQRWIHQNGWTPSPKRVRDYQHNLMTNTVYCQVFGARDCFIMMMRLCTCWDTQYLWQQCYLGKQQPTCQRMLLFNCTLHSLQTQINVKSDFYLYPEQKLSYCFSVWFLWTSSESERWN